MINERGFWEDNGIHNHKYDQPLNEGISKYLKSYGVDSILDLGCGTGQYAERFIQDGFICDCYDGNPNTPEISNNICGVLDLSVPVDLGKTYDCVLSLEVGEHIPEEYESIFIENIVKHSKNLVILSWATIGQGGYGHYNERPNEYIESLFLNYGFHREKEVESVLRQVPQWWWFKNTIMVFKK